MPWTRRAWLGAAAASCAAACTRPSDRTLRFWAMGREGEVATELMAGFEREHPGVRVRVEQLPWSAAHEKLLTAFAGDATPDIAQMGNTWLAEMDALGALEPLQGLVDLDKRLPAADHFEGLWQTNLIGGRLVGVPWYVDTRLLFYRSDLLRDAGFAQPPRSWAEWQATMQALHAGAVPHPMILPLDEFQPLLALALQQPEELLRDGGRYGNFDTPGFRRALDFYVEMYRRDWAPSAGEGEFGNVAQEFGRGRFAFYITGPWYIGEFRRRLPASMQDRWNTAPLPGPNGPGVSVAGGSSLVVFRRSALKPEAARLIEYLCRRDVQQRFYALTGNLPPRRSVWADAPLAVDEKARAFRDQLERVRPSPAVPEWERIVQEMQLVAERVVREHVPVPQALAALNARTDAILEKRRWMLDRTSGRAGAAS